MTQTVTVTKVDVNPAGKTTRIVVHYIGANTKGETWSVGTLTPKLETVSLEYVKALKARLDAGGAPESADLSIEKIGGYRTLTNVSAATNNSTNGQKAAKSYDDTGVKVGASRNQAIAFLAATRGSNFTLDDVDKTAYEIVQRQADQESHVRAGTRPEDLSSLETEKQYAQASLDDIDF